MDTNSNISENKSSNQQIVILIISFILILFSIIYVAFPTLIVLMLVPKDDAPPEWLITFLKPIQIAYDNFHLYKNWIDFQAKIIL